MHKYHVPIKIRNSYEFDRAIHFMTEELIEQVLPVDKCYQYIAFFFLEAATFIKTKPDKRASFELFAKRMPLLLEESKEVNELTAIAESIAKKNVNLERLKQRLLPYLTPTLPSAFQKFTDDKKIAWINKKKVPIKKLNCSYQEIIAFLKASKVPLEFLDLTGMAIKESELITLLEVAPHIKTLIVKKMSLSSTIFNFMPSIESLTLQECGIHPIKENIKKLVSIKELFLPENGIESLPNEIGDLLSLEKLTLSHNRLESLPTSFSKLSSLNTLFLQSNRLRSLPEEIGALSSLELLDASRNDLVEISATIGDLKNLKMLLISHNWLKSLPLKFKNLKKLKLIDLSYNNFNFFPDVLTKLPCLETVHLLGNDIPAIPYELMPKTHFDIEA